MFDIDKFCTQVCDRAYPKYATEDGDTLSLAELERNVEEIKYAEAENERIRKENLTLPPEEQKTFLPVPTEIMLSAYPLRNKWTYKVSDILNVPAPHEVKENLVVVTWRLAGVDRTQLDEFQSGVNFEIIVNASSINALNAFHWALGKQTFGRHDGVRLSDLIGDVEEDEPVSKTMTAHNARAFRVWGLTVNQSVTGMNELFESNSEG